VENARAVAMERRTYKKSKTKIVVIVHYSKRTSTSTSREKSLQKEIHFNTK